MKKYYIYAINGKQKNWYMNKYAWKHFVGCMALVLLASCGGQKEEHNEKEGVETVLPEQLNEVTVVKLLPKTFHHELVSNGKVSAREHADLYFRTAEVVAKANQEMQNIRELRHAVEAFKAKEALGEARSFLLGAKDLGGLKVVTATLPEADGDKLRSMGDFLRDKDEAVVAVLSAVNEGKITFLASCGKAAVAKGIKAGDLIKHVTALCGGKGGGKPDSAMGGGTDVLKLDDALASVDNFVAGTLGL